MGIDRSQGPGENLINIGVFLHYYETLEVPRRKSKPRVKGAAEEEVRPVGKRQENEKN